MSRYKAHKQACNVLKDIEQNPNQYLFIHYSCESFYDIKDGKTPRVTSIAIKSISTGQVESFSMHKTAEQRNISFEEIHSHYNILEREMLDEYFDYIKSHQTQTFLHINMRDINYGFKAIEHRYKVLGGTPFILEDSRKIDFAHLLINLYGDNYIEHPRMQNLCEYNQISNRAFLTGADEAAAFEHKEYIKLHQSTLAKVEMYSKLLDKTVNHSLKVQSKWFEVYGLSIQGIYEFLQSTWWTRMILWCMTLILGGLIGWLFGQL